MTIKIVPLGAGRDVGKSCILVYINNRVLMLDCGMHMGFIDHKRFPNFDQIKKHDRQGYVCNPDPTSTFTELIDAVLISHYHMDHCGALAFFSERKKYMGPIIMSSPTKSIAPKQIDDFRRISIPEDLPNDVCYFTSEDVAKLTDKITTIELGVEIEVCADVFVTAYYAGHVVGAVMFYIRSGTESVLYTGDFSSTPDEHLGAAMIPRLYPDIIITEGTYAGTVRDSKAYRELEFLQQVQTCVENGGRVLIPVFALGRAQELAQLLDSHWRKQQLHTPIYISTGLSLVATETYKQYTNWCNHAIKRNTRLGQNPFILPSVEPLPKDLSTLKGASCVVLSTPGMLHAGTSLALFKQWAGQEDTLLVIPGYCVPASIGGQVLEGKKDIHVTKNGPIIHLKAQVSQLSFSAHADAHGIGSQVRSCGAKHVCLVHGEALKLDHLGKKLQEQLACTWSAPETEIGVSVTNGILTGKGWNYIPKDQQKRQEAQIQHLQTSQLQVQNVYNNNITTNTDEKQGNSCNSSNNILIDGIIPTFYTDSVYNRNTHGISIHTNKITISPGKPQQVCIRDNTEIVSISESIGIPPIYTNISVDIPVVIQNKLDLASTPDYPVVLPKIGDYVQTQVHVDMHIIMKGGEEELTFSMFGDTLCIITTIHVHTNRDKESKLRLVWDLQDNSIGEQLEELIKAEIDAYAKLGGIFLH